MKNFTYSRADSVEGAVGLLSKTANSKFLGGGTNLVDLMRENIEQPDALIDVTRLLPGKVISELPDGGLLIGAAVRNSAVANHALVRERYPLLAQAILFGASGQIRNMATTGAGCDAIGGFNRIHAILGASESCIATHPSDMCVALAALDATVQVQGNGGARSMAMNDFLLLPGDTPQVDTSLKPGELITAIHLPPLAFARN